MKQVTTFAEKVSLGWGKLRRWLLMSILKHRATDGLERRRGSCARSGACCKLLFRCPAFDDSDGQPKCLIYNDRPGVCGLFPIDERDIEDRDLVMPDKKCGYFFVRETEPIDARSDRLLHAPRNGNTFRGTLNILKRLFRRPGASNNGSPRPPAIR
jgi:hypothetical protein